MRERGEKIDALTRRRCAFALYRTSAGRDVFCMQADGGMSPAGIGDGFTIAAYGEAGRLIADELHAPPKAEKFPPAAPTDIEEATTRETYHAVFERAMKLLRTPGGLRKLVLARTADVFCGSVSPFRAYTAACAAHPAAFTALVQTPEHGTWLCSTPELLLSGSGQQWHTMALAGTRPVQSGPWDAKNREEQELVTRCITETLLSFTPRVQALPPHTRNAGRIEHLCTPISFELSAEHIPALLKQLPPTPAVCGYPREQAAAALAAHPDIDRRLYAGYLGPCRNGAPTLYVTLRCMQFLPDRCRLYAGGGLLASSDEETEWQETEAKMHAMRAVMAASTATGGFRD